MPLDQKSWRQFFKFYRVVEIDAERYQKKLSESFFQKIIKNWNAQQLQFFYYLYASIILDQILIATLWQLRNKNMGMDLGWRLSVSNLVPEQLDLVVDLLFELIAGKALSSNLLNKWL